MAGTAWSAAAAAFGCNAATPQVFFKIWLAVITLNHLGNKAVSIQKAPTGALLGRSTALQKIDAESAMRV